MPNVETHIPKRSLTTTLTLLALWIAFYASFTLFQPALLDDADSVHAEVARFTQGAPPADDITVVVARRL